MRLALEQQAYAMLLDNDTRWPMVHSSACWKYKSCLPSGGAVHLLRSTMLLALG